MTETESVQSPLDKVLAEIIDRYRDDRSGEVATYIPELGRADPEWFGVCLATTEGAIYEGGDSRQPFTIQSISKPLVYAMALDKVGPTEVRQRVGVEPSGDAFNSISLQPETGRPLNPMINAGAIAVSSMIYNAYRGDAVQRLLDWCSRFAGEPLKLDMNVYHSESSTGHRNRAIAHLLRNFGVISDPVEEGLDLYFKQCSILTTARDLAVMAATLANHGVNPITGQQAMSRRHVSEVLSVMTTCGMYNYAGQWLYDVGVPAKSGVSGGILAVLPGRMGIGTFSPRLDLQGNSVRGIKVCQELSERFGLHLFSSPRSGRAVIRNQMTLQNRRSSRVRSTADTQRLKLVGTDAYLLELQGDIHFNSMEIIQRRVWKHLPGMKMVIFDFSRVDSADAAGAEGMLLLISSLTREGRQVICCGLSAEGKIRDQLTSGHADVLITADLDSALEASERSLLRGSAVGDNGKTQGDFAEENLSFAELDVIQELSPDDGRFLGKLLIRHELDPGHCLCRKGDQAHDIFFLAKGTVSARLYNNPVNRGEFLRLATFSPGSVFGEIAAIDRGPRSADLWTETPVECYSLSIEAFDNLGDDRPGLKIKMLKYLLNILTTRLRRANDLIEQLAT